MFGEEVTEKLLTVFSGTTIHVPSVREQENAMRDLAIFETLERAEDSSASRRLGEALSSQYKISRRKLRHIYRTMRRLHKLNTKLKAEDLATSQHKKVTKRKRRKR